MPLIRKAPEQVAAAERSGDLAARLTDPSADVRWTAARAAADVPQSVSHLGQGLARESDPRVREAIFTALTRIATPDSILVILPCLRSDDSNLRTAAMDALRTIPALLTPHLGALLEDSDSDVRLLVCDLVRVVPDGDAAALIARLLETEAQPNVCAAAVDVLTEIGDAMAIPSLQNCAARFPNEPFLTFAIKAAVNRLTALRSRG
jgi:HEAT repeat protein